MTLVRNTQCASTVNAWGTLSLYLASYYYLHNHAVTLDLFLVLYTVFCLMNGPGLCILHTDISEVIYKRCGVRLATLVAGCVFCAGFLVCSFIVNPYVFLGVCGVMLGVGEGLTLMTPVWSAWKYFPTNKGKATGAVLLGYGFGPPLFGLVFTFLVNPYNYPATVHVSNGQASYYLFDERVADNIPYALRYFALILSCIYFLSLLLISDPQPGESVTGSIASIGPSVPGVPECPNLKTALKTLTFWQLFVIVTCGTTYSYYLLIVFKAYGQKYYSNDHFLSVLGAVGIVFNAIGRFVLPALLDYCSFKLVYSAGLVAQIAFATSFDTIASHKALFAIWLCASFFASAGQFAMLAIECSSVFGPK